MTIDEFREFLREAPPEIFNYTHQACVELALSRVLPECGGFVRGTEWDQVLDVCDDLFESKNGSKIALKVPVEKMEAIVLGRQNIGNN